MKSPWCSTTLVVTLSIGLLWLVHQGLLTVSSEAGKLTEFGSALFGYIINLWSAFNFNRITSGKWWSTLKPVSMENIESGPSLSGKAGISSGGSIALLAVAWIAIWFYINLLQNSFVNAISDPAVIGVHIDENSAQRIATEFSGLFALGAMLPLMSVAALFLGWLAKCRLTLSQLLFPSSLYVITAATLNNWSEVAKTGLPPSHDAVKMILKSPVGPLSTPDVLLLWLLSLLFAVAVVGFLAGLGWVWSSVGHRLRSVVNLPV